MKFAHILLLLLGFLVIFGCTDTTTNPPENKTIVVVTIAPQAEFAEKIGGDKIQVVMMVPPGSDPHTYEPTPHQLQSISNAAMYAKVGSGVEFELSWMDNLIELNKNMLVVDCSENITLIEGEEHEHEEDEHEHSGTDPHIWTSPKNAMIMVENIYQGLITVDPTNKAYYEQNKNNYIAQLKTLDSNIETALQGKQNKKFIVYHPAWGYFANDYGLEQISIEDEGKEPTPQGIAAAITQAKENNITVIFASPEYSTSSAQTIANEIDGQVLLISPLEKSYISNIEKVAEAFKNSMN